MKSLLQDLRFALRMLRKSPGFTLTVVLTLALGIGANTAIFELANAAFFRALPYPHAEQLAFLWQSDQRTGESELAVSYPNYADWRAQSHAFQDMAIMSSGQVLFAKGQGIERVTAAKVSTNIFSVLGISPILGRDFTAADAIPGPVQSIVISYDLWQRQYGGDPKIIGHSAGSGDAASAIIIGVLPPRFSAPDGTEMWEAIQLIDYLRTKSRQYPIFHVIGRLRRGIKLSSGQAEMNTVAQRLGGQYPAIDGGMGIRIVPLREQFSQNVRQGLLVLWGAVFGVLLIACVNASNLEIARAAGRQKEIAVRFSLGATRNRIVCQFLAESLLLAALGAGAGLFLAYWTVALVSKFNPDISLLGSSIFDARVLLYTIAVAAFTTVICAILPAFSASRLDLSRALKETSSSSASPGTQLIRKILIVAEVSLAVILLVGSGLLVRSLWQILAVNPGFDAGHVLALDIRLPWTAPNVTDDKKYSLYQDLMARLRAMPGVVSVASASQILLPPAKEGVSFVVEGQSSASPEQRPVFPNLQVTSDYFQTLRIPLLRGRLFNDADTTEHAQLVAIIDEAMARRCWPNGDALGKRFRKYDPSRETPWFTVVGVVGDVRLRGLESSAGMVAYEPSSGSWRDDYLVIRTAGDPLALNAGIRDTLRDVDKDLAIFSTTPMSAMLSESESQRKFNAWLLGAFAFIALLLAALGIYGSISYWVKQRTPEIGVRMALGAQPRNIFALVIGRGMAVIFVGLALGVAGALALTRLISTMLFSIRAEDPLTYAVVALLLAAVALFACYVPARRAMRVDPMVALRHE